MPTPLPYVGAYGKIKPLFEKIASAKVPDSFTQRYLSETLGLTSTSDRPLIPLLRALGLIDGAGRPSSDYATLKNSQKAGRAIAKAIKDAYAPLFAANEKAHLLTGDELKGLVAQVAGTDDDMTTRTAGTFRALVGLADPKGFLDLEDSNTTDDMTSDDEADESLKGKSSRSSRGEAESVNFTNGIRPEFHYNIQVHLPSSGTEETYLNIFNALRKALS